MSKLRSKESMAAGLHADAPCLVLADSVLNLALVWLSTKVLFWSI